MLEKVLRYTIEIFIMKVKAQSKFEISRTMA